MTIVALDRNVKGGLSQAVEAAHPLSAGVAARTVRLGVINIL